MLCECTWLTASLITAFEICPKSNWKLGQPPSPRLQSMLMLLEPGKKFWLNCRFVRTENEIKSSDNSDSKPAEFERQKSVQFKIRHKIVSTISIDFNPFDKIDWLQSIFLIKLVSFRIKCNDFDQFSIKMSIKRLKVVKTHKIFNGFWPI